MCICVRVSVCMSVYVVFLCVVSVYVSVCVSVCVHLHVSLCVLTCACVYEPVCDKNPLYDPEVSTIPLCNSLV